MALCYQPLYSSFTADKTFQPPRLPPRPGQRPATGGMAVRDRSGARPSTTVSGSRQGGAAFGNTGAAPAKMQQPTSVSHVPRETGRSAPNGPSNGGGGMPMPMDRPGTVAIGALRASPALGN